MKKNYQKIFILILIFNLHYFAFSKSNNAYSIKCKQEDNGTTCTTNDNSIPKQQPNPTPKQQPNPIPKQQPNPTPKQQPNPIPKQQPNPTPKQKPNPIPKQKPNPIPKQQPNPYSSPQLMETKSNPYSLAAGIGTGNPLVNILISIPYIDIDFGYGGFLYFKSENFHPYILIGIDLIFKQQIGNSLIVGGGFGIDTDWSQANLTVPGTTQPSPYERIGIATRLPISIEYKILQNLSLGLKICSTVGSTIFLTKPTIVFEGMRFKFFAIGFIRVFM
ncbi:hypothetical protein BmHoA_00407 [Borrelia miyamotoi]|uniref:DUF3996 domain-containing protein n=1 Tax=Borrelia miyamotoi TaxID=47466 RepID=UPI001C776BDA|nr:DUF3996 domain-containing protein [Borrelia miyamotoi]BCR19352.1 hypothetical protein BmHoA_00407 [Borrelia miyamotoi]BCR20185.1 hypothetical protein BmHoB_00408 [Borrelia miyamotoi]